MVRIFLIIQEAIFSILFQIWVFLLSSEVLCASLERLQILLQCLFQYIVIAIGVWHLFCFSSTGVWRTISR